MSLIALQAWNRRSAYVHIRKDSLYFPPNWLNGASSGVGESLIICMSS